MTPKGIHNRLEYARANRRDVLSDTHPQGSGITHSRTSRRHNTRREGEPLADRELP
jgi:hypothetical protein